MTFEIYKRLYEIALKEFVDIVGKGEILRLPSGAPLKLRLYLLDDSFVDVWISKEKYSYHWQKGDLFFRHDNAPHERWKHVKTFPKHFHNGSEEKCFTDSNRLSRSLHNARQVNFESVKCGWYSTTSGLKLSAMLKNFSMVSFLHHPL